MHEQINSYLERRKIIKSLLSKSTCTVSLFLKVLEREYINIFSQKQWILSDSLPVRFFILTSAKGSGDKFYLSVRQASSLNAH